MLTRSFILAFAASTLIAQSLDPAKLAKGSTDSWPTYNGDYSGRRFSPLSKINSTNVGSLSLGWVYGSTPQPSAAPSKPRRWLSTA
jgi:Glucose dehydrogenase